MARCQPASADCSEELLRDGIPNDTAAAIATNCSDLIYFSFYNPPQPPPPAAAAPPFFLQHLQSSIHSLPPPSVLPDRYTACTRDTISSSAPRHWQETSVSRSLCHKVLESGEVTGWIGQPGEACGQSGVGGAGLAGVRGRPGGNLSPGPSCLACLVPFVSVCVCVCFARPLREREFVGQRAPRHQKQLRAAWMCPRLPPCSLPSPPAHPTPYLPSSSLTLRYPCKKNKQKKSTPLARFSSSRVTAGDAPLRSATVWPVLISLHLDCLNCLSSLKFLFT